MVLPSHFSPASGPFPGNLVPVFRTSMVSRIDIENAQAHALATLLAKSTLKDGHNAVPDQPAPDGDIGTLHIVQSTRKAPTIGTSAFLKGLEDVFRRTDTRFQINERDSHHTSARTPDLGMVDLRGLTLSDDHFARLCAISEHVPGQLIFLTPSIIDPARLASLAQIGAIVPPSSLKTGLPELCRDLRRLLHMGREVAARSNSLIQCAHPGTDFLLAELGGDTDDHKPHFLIAGEPGPTVLGLVNTIYRAGATAECVYRPGQAIRALETGAFDGVVFLPSKKSDPLNALARAMRRHHQFHTVPLMMIETGEPGDSVALKGPGRWMGAQDIPIFFNAVFDAERLLASRLRHVKNLLKQQQRLFHPRQGQPVNAPRLFSAHLQTLFQEADHNKTILSFAIIRLKYDQHTIDHNSQNDIAPLHPLIKTIHKTIRAHDFAAVLHEEPGHTILALNMGAQTNETLNKITGRVESLLRSGALTNDGQTIASPMITTGTYHRPTSLCLEESVAGMLRGL